MLTTFYVYRALAREWDEILRGREITGSYSGSKNELVIALSDGSAVVFGIRGSFRYLFRSERYGRPRRNAVALLPAVTARTVTAVEIADRDRILCFNTSDRTDIVMVLFGSRPNVLISKDGLVLDAFKSGSTIVGTAEPVPRPCKQPTGEDALRALHSLKPGSNLKTVSRAFPLFDREIASEVVYRAGLERDADFESANAERLSVAASAVSDELEKIPAPRIYWSGDIAETVSLIQLRHRSTEREERFDSVDNAVTVFCRRRLSQLALSERLVPVQSAVADAAARAERRLAGLETQLAQPSRADTYERWGHLLMASGRGADAGLARITVTDLFETGDPVEIPLKEEETVIDNAQWYYDRARKARISRASALSRVDDARNTAQRLKEDVIGLGIVRTLEELDAFLESTKHLRSLGGVTNSVGGDASVPYRRFDLAHEYTVFVGRNARENNQLTFGFARRYDIWMHARGVPGSHTLLRLPQKDSVPDQRTLESAASIAAYFSKARGSGLVPVAYAPTKYVRKAKGGVPGKVIVEREKVLLVSPGLPKGR